MAAKSADNSNSTSQQTGSEKLFSLARTGKAIRVVGAVVPLQPLSLRSAQPYVTERLNATQRNTLGALQMHRRSFLKTAAVAPLAATPLSRTVAAQDGTEAFTGGYYQSLPETRADRRAAVVGCATTLCAKTSAISRETIEAVVTGSTSAKEVVRRVQLAVGILNEFNVTTAVTEATVKTYRWDLNEMTRFLPLLGAFNNLQHAACRVRKTNEESIEQFLYATLAFGLEVGLWTVGAPYKMAWNGTRFVSNRTFLRLANHGCNRCIALAMSELHYALRGTVYSGIEEDRIAFVVTELHELQAFAATLADEEDYHVAITLDRKQVKTSLQDVGDRQPVAVAPVEKPDDGFLDRLIPEINVTLTDFDVSDLWS